MTIELKVPTVGESITQVQLGRWLVHEGDQVNADAPLVEIESDKVTVELPAPAAGTVGRLLKQQGEQAAVGEVIGYLEANGAAGSAPKKSAESPAAEKAPAEKETPKPAAAAKKPAETPPPAAPEAKTTKPEPAAPTESKTAKPAPPAPAAASAPSATPAPKPQTPAPAPSAPPVAGDREQVVAMTPMRARIAQRLVEAQQNTASLTTFNEVDMTEVMALRNLYKDVFAERYGVKLGFMSFFVKAVVEALKGVPQVNAEIRGNHIVYKNYYHIGVAVGGGKGLVVPVVRDADRLSYAEIEMTIADLAKKAMENRIELKDLLGGTFTISNGGVYGSMLSTPILNPPQSGILGMHTIQERPVARNGQVVIKPMMYLALTYDHRLVDGREAVSFLKRIKETIEAPLRVLIEV